MPKQTNKYIKSVNCYIFLGKYCTNVCACLRFLPKTRKKDIINLSGNSKQFSTYRRGIQVLNFVSLLVNITAARKSHPLLVINLKGTTFTQGTDRNATKLISI